ncbi:hypothetical protein SPFL3102_00553 [Sporomusaceae bacterium FL31]|nr:hypothetical protein SPFL3101_01398 [Sporomusaceae bacterium FL31]GCE32757.1 hypothetical protein SPFL3102_00553 [Sporomusaceae bacterium]
MTDTQLIEKELEEIDAMLCELECSPSNWVATKTPEDLAKILRLAKLSCMIRLFLEQRAQIGLEEVEDLKAMLKYPNIFT